MKSVTRKYDRRYVPSPERFCRIMEMIITNQGEMAPLVAYVTSLRSELAAGEDPRLLLKLGSYFYDYYLSIEEILLAIASLTDQWMPGSLDWHLRLLKLLKTPIAEVRPPVLSASTAGLLEDYLYFYLSFHHNCGNLSREKMIMLAESLERTHEMVLQDLDRFHRVLKMLYRP